MEEVKIRQDVDALKDVEQILSGHEEDYKAMTEGKYVDENDEG